MDVPLSDYLLRLPQLRDARVAYYDWVKASLQHRVAERSLGRARMHLAAAQTALALGTASQADVLAVEAQVANAEYLFARAQAATQVQGGRLSVLMHEPAPIAYEIGEHLNAPARRARARRAKPCCCSAR